MEHANVYQPVLPEEETKLYKGLKRFIYQVGIGVMAFGAFGYVESAVKNYANLPESAGLLNNVIAAKSLFWGGAICAINFAVGRFMKDETDNPSDLELSTKPKTDSLDGSL